MNRMERVRKLIADMVDAGDVLLDDRISEQDRAALCGQKLDRAVGEFLSDDEIAAWCRDAGVLPANSSKGTPETGANR